MTLRPTATMVAERGDARRLRVLWDDGCLRVGQKIALAGRYYVIRGFDPVGTHQRRIYVEDFASGAQRRVFVPEP